MFSVFSVLGDFVSEEQCIILANLTRIAMCFPLFFFVTALDSCVDGRNGNITLNGTCICVTRYYGQFCTSNFYADNPDYFYALNFILAVGCGVGKKALSKNFF